MIAIATVMLMTTLKFIFHWLRRELQPRRSCLEIRAAIRWSYTIVVHLGVIDDSARRHTARAGAECSRVWPILEPQIRLHLFPQTTVQNFLDSGI